MATATQTGTGRVIQITGPVVDIEFPAGELPAIYNAVEIQREGQTPLTCEVQQHLGNNWVRAVAMTTTDGLARGVDVLDTGGPISVPVGDVTLGRVFDVLGNAIDGKEAVSRTNTLPIHRSAPAFGDVLPLARLITDDYLAGTYGRVDIIYSRFVSTLVQRPEVFQLLPIRPTEDTEGIPGNQFIFEPGPAAVLEQLVPRYIATRLFQAVLEAKASEESSRMVAMKNATENAEELIEDLTLSYNKVRQSNITREMIEIASGANAR